MRSWQYLVTSSYSIRTSQITQTRTSLITQTSVCHADTTQLLHVAYTDQSAHQICSPKLIFVFVRIRH